MEQQNAPGNEATYSPHLSGAPLRGGLVMQIKKKHFFLIKNSFFLKKKHRPKKNDFLSFFIIIYNLKARKCFLYSGVLIHVIYKL